MGIGYGTTLSYDSGGGTYAAIAKVRDTKGPGIKVPSVDGTNNDSPNATREKEPGLIDSGQVKLELIHSNAAYSTLLSLLRLIKTWKITYPDTSTSTFSAFITELDRDDPMAEERVIHLTLEVTGADTFVHP